jgi:hypothetical protein
MNARAYGKIKHRVLEEDRPLLHNVLHNVYCSRAQCVRSSDPYHMSERSFADHVAANGPRCGWCSSMTLYIGSRI